MSMRAADEKTEEMLTEYVEGRLEPARRAEVDAYLAAHPREKVVIDQLIANRAAVGALHGESAPADVYDAVRDQLERASLLDGIEEEAGHSRWRWTPQVLAAAAVMLLTTGLCAIVFFVIFPQDRSRPLAANDAARTEAARAEAAANELGKDLEHRHEGAKPGESLERDHVAALGTRLKEHSAEGTLGGAASVAGPALKPGEEGTVAGVHTPDSKRKDTALSVEKANGFAGGAAVPGAGQLADTAGRRPGDRELGESTRAEDRKDGATQDKQELLAKGGTKSGASELESAAAGAPMTPAGAASAATPPPASPVAPMAAARAAQTSARDKGAEKAEESQAGEDVLPVRHFTIETDDVATTRAELEQALVAGGWASQQVAPEKVGEKLLKWNPALQNLSPMQQRRQQMFDSSDYMRNVQNRTNLGRQMQQNVVAPSEPVLTLVRVESGRMMQMTAMAEKLGATVKPIAGAEPEPADRLADRKFVARKAVAAPATTPAVGDADQTVEGKKQLEWKVEYVLVEVVAKKPEVTGRVENGGANGEVAQNPATSTPAAKAPAEQVPAQVPAAGQSPLGQSQGQSQSTQPVAP